MILNVHMTAEDYAIDLAECVRTRDWIIELMESEMSFRMLTSFARTSELFETKKALRARVGHWNWRMLYRKCAVGVCMRQLWTKLTI
jgi:hypothetical protein